MEESNPYSPPQSNTVSPPDSPAPSLWNPDVAGAWSLLFTPIFGSVLLLKNWRAIGREDKIGNSAYLANYQHCHVRGDDLFRGNRFHLHHHLVLRMAKATNQIC